MKNAILIKKDKPSIQIIIISFFIQFLGIFFISSSGWLWWKLLIGTVLFFTGLIIINLQSELYFNYGNNSLVVKWKSLFFKKEKKEELPEIQYLAIVRVKVTKSLNYKSITTYEGGYMCNLNFIYKESEKRYRKIYTTNKEKVIQLAKVISGKINKPILDNSTTDKKWLNINS